MKGEELTRQLTQYAAAGQPTTTVTAGGATLPARAGYPVIVTGGCPGGNCGAQQYVIPAGYPFGSSCPNGRCPNAR